MISALGRVSRVAPVQTELRNRTKDEGGSFGLGRQGLILGLIVVGRNDAMGHKRSLGGVAEQVRSLR